MAKWNGVKLMGLRDKIVVLPKFEMQAAANGATAWTSFLLPFQYVRSDQGIDRLPVLAPSKPCLSEAFPCRVTTAACWWHSWVVRTESVGRLHEHMRVYACGVLVPTCV